MAEQLSIPEKFIKNIKLFKLKSFAFNEKNVLKTHNNTNIIYINTIEYFSSLPLNLHTISNGKTYIRNKTII